MQLKLYLIIITVCALLGTVAVSLFYSANFFATLGIMVLGIVLVLVVDGITAAICRMLPTRCANFESKIYIVSIKEKKLYEKLKIRAWKDKIPEIGHFTGFRKNKISDPKNPEYVQRFLMEICYGELGHTISVFTGFLLLLLPWFSPVWMALSIIIATVNAILNLLPVMVLRYNSYKLSILYKRLKKQ